MRDQCLDKQRRQWQEQGSWVESIDQLENFPIDLKEELEYEWESCDFMTLLPRIWTSGSIRTLVLVFCAESISRSNLSRLKTVTRGSQSESL